FKILNCEVLDHAACMSVVEKLHASIEQKGLAGAWALKRVGIQEMNGGSYRLLMKKKIAEIDSMMIYQGDGNTVSIFDKKKGRVGTAKFSNGRISKIETEYSGGVSEQIVAATFAQIEAILNSR